MITFHYYKVNSELCITHHETFFFLVFSSRLKNCTALPCSMTLIDHTSSSLVCQLGMDYKLSPEVAKSGLQEKRQHVCLRTCIISLNLSNKLLYRVLKSHILCCILMCFGSVCRQWPGPLCLQGSSGLQHRNLWYLPTDCCF